MSTAKSIASGYHGSKRVACDRCREQKSRCPRETGASDSGKCARCAKAGAVCNFGTSLRAGRPSTSASKALSKQRKNFASSQPSRQNSDTNLAAPWEALTEEPGDRNDEATNPEDNLSFLSPDCSEIWMGGTFNDEASHSSSRRTTLSRDASQHLPKTFNAFSTRDIAMLGEEDLDFLKQSDLLNKTLCEAEEETSPMDLDPFACNYNWDPKNPMCPSTTYLSQLRNASFAESPTPMLFTPPESSLSDASRTSTNESRMNSCTKSSEKLAGTGRLPHLHARSADKFQWEGYNPITPDSISSRTQDGNLESPPAYHSFPTHDIQHRRMHELSELGLNFYSQVKETASRDEGNPLALTLPNNLAVKVLESSVKFLNLLTSLYPVRPPQSHPTDSPSSTSSDEDIPTTTTTHHRSQAPHQRHHPSADDTRTRDDFSPQPVDLTEVFALLTCYIRILHLHHLLYSRMSDFLSTLFQRGAHLPPLFPGVQAGTLSLDTFAKFQVKLLIQISTHVLGEIEMALGLPDGYRISKRNRQRQGIFEGSVSAQFIEMTMNEKGKAGLGIEKDRFTSIRDHLGRLRQLLKGTINP